MILSPTNIGLVVVYFLVIFAIGFWVKRRETASEYLIADRKIGLLQATASIFAVLGAVLLVGQAALAFDLGFGAMWLWVGIALGLVILGFSLGKIKRLSDEKKYLTISDYISSQFGYKNGVLSGVILFLAFFALLTGQFIAGASLFSPLLGLSYSTAVIILGVGTLTYLLLGGFKAVIKTDLLQFLIMAVVFVAILSSLNIGELDKAQFSLTTVDTFTALSLLLIGTFTIFAAADIWQRVFAARDVKTARNASFISAILFVAFGFVVSLVGIAAKQSFPNIDPSEALFYGLFELMPEALLGVIVIAVLAAIMSTIDTELFYLSSSIAKDFSKDKNEKTNDHIVKIIFRSLIILAVVSMFTAIFLSDIVLLLFALLSLTLCVAPVIIASSFWKLKSNAVFLSMSTGLLSFIILLLMGNLTPDTAVITLPTAVVFLILGQLFLPKKEGVLTQN